MGDDSESEQSRMFTQQSPPPYTRTDQSRGGGRHAGYECDNQDSFQKGEQGGASGGGQSPLQPAVLGTVVSMSPAGGSASAGYGGDIIDCESVELYPTRSTQKLPIKMLCVAALFFLLGAGAVLVMVGITSDGETAPQSTSAETLRSESPDGGTPYMPVLPAPRAVRAAMSLALDIDSIQVPNHCLSLLIHCPSLRGLHCCPSLLPCHGWLSLHFHRLPGRVSRAGPVRNKIHAGRCGHGWCRPKR